MGKFKIGDVVRLNSDPKKQKMVVFEYFQEEFTDQWFQHNAGDVNCLFWNKNERKFDTTNYNETELTIIRENLNKNRQFKIEDIVHLKSGSPKMTIDEINGNYIHCINGDRDAEYPSEVFEQTCSNRFFYWIKSIIGKTTI